MEDYKNIFAIIWLVGFSYTFWLWLASGENYKLGKEARIFVSVFMILIWPLVWISIFLENKDNK